MTAEAFDRKWARDMLETYARLFNAIEEGKVMSVQAAAELLEVTDQRITALVREGRIRVVSTSPQGGRPRQWLNSEDVHKIRDERRKEDRR